MQFQQLKLDIIETTGLAKDAMHVHIGLLAFVLVRLLWRWRGGWAVAWLVALAVAGTGEWLDYRGNQGANINPDDRGHWHDLWNTMLWPTILLFIGRWLHPRPTQRSVAPITDDVSADIGDSAALNGAVKDRPTI